MPEPSDSFDSDEPEDVDSLKKECDDCGRLPDIGPSKVIIIIDCKNQVNREDD